MIHHQASGNDVEANAYEMRVSVNPSVGADTETEREDVHETKSSIWNEIWNVKSFFNWNDFCYQFILCLTPTVLDMGTDFNFAAELLSNGREEDVLAAGLCYIFITLPLLQMVFHSIPWTSHVVITQCLRYQLFLGIILKFSKGFV